MMKAKGKINKIRNNIGRALFFLSAPLRRLFPIALELIRCECGSWFQGAAYKFKGEKDNYTDFKRVYKKYICGDCGKIRYYMEQRLKHNPLKRRKKHEKRN